jgi:outer membrane immunogenic protein
MKKFALAISASILAAGAASAADMAPRTYTKAPAPVVAPVTNWGGFYIGINGGGGSAHKCWDRDQCRYTGESTVAGGLP